MMHPDSEHGGSVCDHSTYLQQLSSRRSGSSVTLEVAPPGAGRQAMPGRAQERAPPARVGGAPSPINLPGPTQVFMTEWPHRRSRTPWSSHRAFLQLPIWSAGTHQLLVRAALNHLAVGQDDDLIDLFESLQLVRYEQGGPACGESEQVGGQGSAGFRIQVGVGSSRISTAGSARSALARASRCRSPPDMATPCAPTGVSQRRGSE
jgi:hypothetical protein